MRFSWLSAAALALATTSHASTSGPSGIYEIDLIFPGNNSRFSPADLIPLVFAVRNPGLTNITNADIGWTLSARNTSVDTGFAGGEILRASLNDTSFVTVPLSTVVGVEQEWRLRWGVGVATQANPYHYISQDQLLFFNTSLSAAAPDLTAWNANASNTCARAGSAIAFNITSTETLSNGTVEISYGASPSPSPCALTINASQVSSFSAAATTSACATPSALGSAAHSICGTSAATHRITAAGLGVKALALSAGMLVAVVSFL